MIRKLFALLALVGLAAAPSWAATFKAVLKVEASEGGTVSASKSNSEGSYGSSQSATSDGQYTLAANYTHTMYAFAKADTDSGYTFAGWYSDSSYGTLLTQDNPYARSIKVSTSDQSSGGISKTYTRTDTIYAKFVKHEHSFAYSISGDKITKTCTADGCPGGVGGTATLTANGATYDGKSHAASVATTGDVTASLSYNTTDGQAPTAAGTYEVTMKVDGGTAANTTLTKSFTISPASITAVTLNSTSFNYDGTDKTTSIKSVKAGSLTPGAGDYDVSGEMTQVGSLTEKKTYTVTVTGKGNYTGSASASWSIVAPTGALGKMTPNKGCAVDSGDANNVVVAESRELDYDPNTGKWSVGINVVVPNEDVGKITDPTVTFPDDLYVTATPQDAVRVKKNYEYNNGSSRKYYYMTSVDADASFSKEDVEAAVASSGKLVFTVELWAKAGQYNEKGIKATTYTMTVLIDENFILNDQYGNQVYPALPYIANIGAKKFLTLADALGSELATAGQTIEVFAAAEASAFVVPLGVTVNLGAYGAEGATYELVVDDDHLGDVGAKIISTKAETVTTATGFGVKPDNFTYTLYRAHQHNWAYTLNGATLTATCQAADCDVSGATVAMSIKATSNGDGQAPTLSFSESKENFVMLTDAEVGEITVERPSYSANNWYVGAYTASCVVKAGGQNYTLTQNLEILKPESDYTSGFEARGIGGGYDVRFNTFAEAAGATTNGATIYYRGGSKDQSDYYDFTSDKNVTVDLGEATLKQTKKRDALYLQNNGVGTVTLVNGTIHQPKYGLYNAEDVKFTGKGNGGKFVLGANLRMTNEANDHANSMTIYGENVGVEIAAGQYEIVGLGSGVLVSGGQFWNEFSPDASHLAANRIVRTISGNYPNEVVEHTHHIFYSATDNVITAVCDTNNHEHCGFGTQTLTLNAENEKVSGKPYSSATIAYSDNFPIKDAVITYWQNNEQLAGAPTETSDYVYVAKVTVGGATAVAEFKIFHEHEYTIEQTDDVTLTATCRADGTCNAPTRTLKLVAESRDWQKGTVFAASLEDGFGEEIAYTVSYVYKQGGETIAAPKLTGEYTVEATVMVAETPYVLTKAFAITKPTGGYTAGYEVKGAAGEESKWLCYDSFSDAVAAAEKNGTVVWHEAISGSEFSFTSDKEITIDCSEKSLTGTTSSITVKNTGSGRVTLENLTIGQYGPTHSVKVNGPVSFGDGVSCTLSLSGLETSTLKIIGGWYNFDPSNYVDGKGDTYVVDRENALSYRVRTHTHKFKTSASGNVLTVKCEGTDSNLCDFGKGATITLKAADALADGTTYAGVSVDNQVTGDWAAKLPDAAAVSLDDIVYYAAKDESTPLEGAPKDAGDYVVTLTYDGQTARATFSILPADISTGTFELNWETIAYDGQPHENAIKTAKIGETPIVLGRDFEVSGDFTQTGSPAKDETYTVTLTGIGNFKGTTNLTWTITAPTGEMGKLEEVKGEGQSALAGIVEGRTLTVTLPTNLCFLNGAWYAGLSVDVPNDVNWASSSDSSGTNPNDLRLTISHEGDLHAVDEDSYTWTLSQKTINYAKSITWFAKFTAAEIEEAIGNGDTAVVRTLAVSAVPGEFNNAGIREVVYTIMLPLEGLVLPVPAGATLGMAGTKFASEDEYKDYPYQLQLGAGAKVYGDPEVDDGYIYNEDGLTTTVEGYGVACVDVEGAQEGECAYYFTTLPINYNIGYSFEDADGNTLTDVTNPYSSKKTYTIEDEVAFTEPATLDGYEFVGWNPVKIAKGSTGKQTITGTFKRSITPTAQVAEVTLAPEGLDVAATFTLGEYAANYGDWKADFILTADQNLAKDAITLKGEIPSQTTGWVALALADDYTAGTSLSIIGLAMAKLPLALPVYYWELKDMGTFNCGLVANKIEVETKVTVSLVLSKEGEDPMTLAMFETTLQKTSTPYEDVVIDDTDDGKTVAPEVKQAAAEKVEELCNSDESNIDAVKTWVKENNVKAADLAKSEYTKASYDLGVALLDKGESVAEVAFDDVAEDSANGFSFKIAVQFEGEATPEVVKAAKDKVVGYIQAVDVLGDEFGPVDPGRVEIDLTTGKVTITPAEGKASEFFKIVIPKDK